LEGFKIATYNVNSIRSRLHIILPWLESAKPAVLCMQETKTEDPLFPVSEFEALGYHAIFKGSKKGSGVAIVTTMKPDQVVYGMEDGQGDEDRLITASLSGIIVMNAYVPQGFKMEASQFAYKLAWFQRFYDYLSRNFDPRQKLILCGDLNIAREGIDVHNPKRILGHVDFNPVVWKEFDRIRDWGFIDIFRKHHPGEPNQYTFFDYRAPRTVEKGLGWRVDHILATKPLAEHSVGCSIDMNPRLAEKPSDHTVLHAEFKI